MSLYCCMWVISRGAAICHPMHAFNSLWRCPPLPIQTLITTSLPFPPILSFLLTAPCRSYPFLPRSIPTPVILTLSLRAHSCPLTYLHSYPRTHCLTVSLSHCLSVSLSRCLAVSLALSIPPRTIHLLPASAPLIVPYPPFPYYSVRPSRLHSLLSHYLP